MGDYEPVQVTENLNYESYKPKHESLKYLLNPYCIGITCAIIFCVGLTIFVATILAIFGVIDHSLLPKGCSSYNISATINTLQVKQKQFSYFYDTTDGQGNILGFPNPIIDFETPNYEGSKYAIMNVNSYTLYDCSTNSVEFTMNLNYPGVFLPTWDIRGKNGNYVGTLKQVNVVGLDQSLRDSQDREIAYFSHPVVYFLSEWTITISNLSVSQGIQPYLYPFIVRSIEYHKS